MDRFQPPAPLAELLQRYRRPADITEVEADGLSDPARANVHRLLGVLRGLVGVDVRQLMAKYREMANYGAEVPREVAARDLTELLLDLADAHCLLQKT